MADGTKIEWTDATWNPITGCSVVSPGCTNCYAMRLAGTRLQRHRSRAGLTRDSKAGPVWTGDVRLNEEWLLQPLQWRRPRMIFVCAHGDLFHENVPDEWIDRVFAVMALAPQHVFQVLTKRPERMRNYLAQALGRIADTVIQMRRERGDNGAVVPLPHIRPGAAWWPLSNVWLGTSVEDQARADERVRVLAHWREGTPAAVRWLSCEPLLGPVIICEFCARGHKPMMDSRQDPRQQYHAGAGGFGDECGFNGLHWIVLGGESGPGARPMHPDWARSVRDQCAAAGVAFHFKQWGSWLPWEPEHLPEWRSQNGGLLDRHALPGFNDLDLKGWTDSLLYEGEDICVHQLVGKKAAGRLLDGVEHNGMPNSSGGIQQ